MEFAGGNRKRMVRPESGRDGGQKALPQKRFIEKRGPGNRYFGSLAGLLVTLGIDIGTIYSLLWTRSDPATRKEMFLDCYGNAVRRIKNKLRKEEQTIRELCDSSG